MSESNGYATRDELFGSGPPKRRFKDVTVRLGKFRIRSMSALEANTIQARHLAEDDTDKKVKEIACTNVRYIVASVVNADGQLEYGNLDIVKWLDLDAADVAELAKECQKFAEHDPEGVEKAEKNSDAIAG
jgi:hypothetical protein